VGERSRNRALELFSPDRILRLYEALYRRENVGLALSIPPCYCGNAWRADRAVLFKIGNRKSDRREISSQENPSLFGKPAGATTCVRLFCRSDPGSSWRENKKENPMKTLTTVISMTWIAFTASASEAVPYIPMPIDNGYAIDAHGKRQPNALCARDVIWACPRDTRYGRTQATRPVGRETIAVTVCIGSILI